MGKVTPKVSLVRATPDAAGAIASAARLCYASDTDDILEQDSGDAERFVKMLVEMGHMSPIEHASFTFYIEGVSRAMTHQLVRHRLASYSQRSQRYVAEDSFDYIMPPQFEGKTIEVDGELVDAADYFAETMQIIAGRYGKLNDALGRCGESSNQDARYVLPNACETKIFVTMNARELLHFFGERMCNRAQWEIREVAGQMLALAKKTAPALFNGVGPKCVALGRCPEGKMSCGQHREMIAKYGRTAGRTEEPENAETPPINE